MWYGRGFGYGQSVTDDDALAFSFPNDLGYGHELHADVQALSDEARPRILLTGPRRAGKSSIAKVVFHKMSPNETLFLESTSAIVRDDIASSAFVQFQIWDFPGDMEFDEPSLDADAIFKRAGALIFVIDAQDEIGEALAKLHATVARCFQVNPTTKFEVFIHKVDALTDDQKLGVQRTIQQQVMDELVASKLDGIHLNFYLTSIYDHSVFEAFSKVIQKLVPQLATLENLLDILLSNCRMEKVFLIDVVSKLYVATDSSPVDMQIYELCSDMIDVIIDVASIYGTPSPASASSAPSVTTKPAAPSAVSAAAGGTSAVIKLSNEMVLYLREINKYLALVALIRKEKFDKQGLIDYNFDTLKKAVLQLFDLARLHQQQQQQHLQQQQQHQGK